MGSEFESCSITHPASQFFSRRSTCCRRPEQNQVLEFVKTQLSRNIEEAIEVYPFSTRAGYEHLRTAFAADFIDRFRAKVAEQRAANANRKIATLVRVP